jgi:zinc transport system substrate-binding protein
MRKIFFGLLVSLGALSCAVSSGAPLRILVSLPPQAYLLECVGGSRVRIEVLVPPGQSPATYVVSARRMARLTKAVAWFRIGVPFENALLAKLKSVAPNLKIVDTRQGITLRHMHDAHAHEATMKHGRDKLHEAQHHNPDATDPHTWLNPLNAVIQANTICTTLCALDPAGSTEFRRNADALCADLKAVHEHLKQALLPIKGKTLMVFHPSFGYFADAYGLRQEPIEIAGKAPTGRQLAEVIRRARKENVRVIFVQPQFSNKSARVVAGAIGAVVVPIDPLARDYLDNLKQLAVTIAKGLAAQQQRTP